MPHELAGQMIFKSHDALIYLKNAADVLTLQKADLRKWQFFNSYNKTLKLLKEPRLKFSLKINCALPLFFMPNYHKDKVSGKLYNV